jgi:DNA gyrase subunit A
MAKDKQDNLETENQEPEVRPPVQGTLGDVNFEKVMSENFLVYAWSTLLDRALPQIDGLLPVQRRVLLAMDHSKNYSNKPTRKCAGVVGDTMGKYHPHGDLSIYGALARMTQDFSLRVPLIHGQGSFGSIDGNKPAAMRYTECRMNPASEQLVKDLDPEILPDYMGRTFDEALPEPQLLPVRFPNLLINGAYGIGTGMTTLFLPHNPGEAIDLCIWRAKNPEASLSQAVKKISGPDFPTGGSVVNDQGLKDLYTKGKGRVTGLAKAHIEKGDKGKDKIIISELPWMMNKGGDSGIVKSLITHYNKGSYPEFEDLNDFSTKEIRIEIKLKRGVNSAAVLQRLLKQSILRKTYAAEMNCVINGKPKTINLLEIADSFLEFRRYIVVKRAEKRIREIDRRLHRLEAYMKVIGATDKVVQIIKKSKDRNAAKEPLKKLLKIDDLQVQYIIEMPLGSLTQLDAFKIKEEVKELTQEKKTLEKLIKTPDLITTEIVDELSEIKAGWKKDGVLERRTSVVEESASEDISEASMTSTGPSEDCILMISKKGQVLCAQGTIKRGGSLKLKEGDYLVAIDHTDTNSEYLIFSDQGNAYRLRLGEVVLESKRTTGDKLASIIGIKMDEEVVAAHPIKADDEGDFFFVSEQGMIKRVAKEEFSKTHASGIVAAKLGSGDRLIAVQDNRIGDKAEILMLADNGKMLRCLADVSRVMGRAAGGVKGMKVPGGNKLISAEIIYPDKSSERQLLIVQAGGYAKRMELKEIPTKGRGGGGVAIGKIDGKYGQPTASMLISNIEKSELYYQEDGKLRSFKVKDIALGKRATTAKPFPVSNHQIIDYQLPEQDL